MRSLQYFIKPYHFISSPNKVRTSYGEVARLKKRFALTKTCVGAIADENGVPYNNRILGIQDLTGDNKIEFGWKCNPINPDEFLATIRIKNADGDHISTFCEVESNKMYIVTLIVAKDLIRLELYKSAGGERGEKLGSINMKIATFTPKTKWIETFPAIDSKKAVNFLVKVYVDDRS